MKTSEALLRIFYRPREVFADQRHKPTWIRTFFIVLAILLADMSITNLSPSWQNSVESVDSAKRDATLEGTESSELGSASTGYAITESATEYTHQFTVESYRGSEHVLPTLSFTIFTLIFLFVLLLLNALYLRIVGAFLGLDLKLDHWLAFVTWSLVPGEALVLFLTIAMVVTVSVSTEFLGFELLVITRIFEGTSTSNVSLESFLHYSYLSVLWTVALQTIGFGEWSGKGSLLAFFVVIVPFMLIFGLLWWVFASIPFNG